MSMLFSDYDGTFANTIENISINCDAVANYMRRGNVFVLSSGRSFESLFRKTIEHNIPYDYLACADGCYLFDKNGKLLLSHQVSHDSVSQVRELEDLAHFDRIDYTYERDYSVVYDSKENIASISFVIKDKNVNSLFLKRFNELKMENPQYDYVVYGFEDTSYYMIKAKGISKSAPIDYLKDKLMVPRKEIFTVGDGINDMEMIRDYNGFMIGSKKELYDVALDKYDSVHELVNDIMNKKVKRR